MIIKLYITLLLQQSKVPASVQWIHEHLVVHHTVDIVVHHIIDVVLHHKFDIAKRGVMIRRCKPG